MTASIDTSEREAVELTPGEQVREIDRTRIGAVIERDTSKPAEQQGLFHKFDVQRTDGSSKPGMKHHRCEYFVLDVDHDPMAIPALAIYASAAEDTHPELANDLRTRYSLPDIPGTSTRAHLTSQILVMADLLKSAIGVVRTVTGDSTEESDLLQTLIDQSEAAIATVLTEHAMGGKAHG